MNTHHTQSTDMTIESLGQAQKERLAYIDFRLFFLGDARRQDLIQRFGIAPAVATRDFAQYKDLFPKNIEFETVSKRYVTGENFSPQFSHQVERVLTALSQGFGDASFASSGAMVQCVLPLTLNKPKLAILAMVSRAIYLKRALRIDYQSHSSGMGAREIVPFALVNDGLRWHTRAYDRKSKRFIDCVLSRILSAELINSEIADWEQSAEDIDWNRIVRLELVPHPQQTRAEIIESDYGMENGVLLVQLRAAIAGYFLRQWIVDCSPNHCLQGAEYRLWLKNHLALYDVSSAVFAPGYVSGGIV